MIGQWTSRVPKMVGIQIGSRQVALMRVMLCLALCVLIGGIAPIAAASHRNTGVPQGGGTTASTALDAQPATYRYAGQPDGTTVVQRSKDGGLTWPTVGMIPELVAQLAANPANDTVVFARTGASLWRSGNGGVSWAHIDSLPGRPLALAFAGSSEPSGLIFAGSDTQGLYSSLDGGTTWQAAGGPLSPVGAGSLAVTALAVNPGDQHVVYAAATFTMATPEGRHSLQSVFISVDDGRRWFEMTSAQRFDRTVTQLIPFSDPFLAVLLVAPFGSSMASLEVTPALISGLDGADAGTRAATARALGLSQDRSLLPVLMNHLRDPDLLAGDRVAQAIGRLGDLNVVPLLIPALSDTDEVIRARAATAVGLLHAEEAIPQLGTILRHDGPWASRYAAEALAAIGTPAAIAALMAPLADQQVTSARHAAMGGLEAAGSSAVAPLAAALHDDNAVVRANAAEMLGWLKPVEDPLQRAGAVTDLARLLSDPDPTVQVQAVWALGEIGTEPARLALIPASIPAPKSAPILAPMAARPVAPAPRAALPGAIADVPADYWPLAARMALLVLALLAILLIWKGPRPTSHVGPA